jgi:hypothetical protein
MQYRKAARACWRLVRQMAGEEVAPVRNRRERFKEKKGEEEY